MGSPASSIAVDGFSARWTRSMDFSNGTYRFHTKTDDGVRLWVDGALLIDKWINQGNVEYISDRIMTAGTHTLKIEYYEGAGGAAAKFWVELLYPDWKAEYWNNKTLSGAPVMVRNDVGVNFEWGAGSPGGAVPADNFSARWTRARTFNAGTYRFYTRTDDGVRLWIDGVLVIDKWQNQAPTQYYVDRYMTAGAHIIKMEYFDSGGGASAHFWPEQLN